MKCPKLLFALSGLILLGIGITIAGDGIQPEYQPTEKAYYLSAAQVSFVRPGLKVVIQKVDLSQTPNVIVTFQLTDAQSQPLDRLGIQSPGVVALQFILARIKPGDTQYSNYFSRSFTNAVTGAAMQLPATDTTGTYADLGNGVYRYTFGNKLPSDFDSDSTHTLAIQAARDLTAFDMGKFVANTTFDFVPSGAPVTQVRDIVRIENCNQCHDPLALHGGNRIDTKLCVLCHQPQNTDPPTNNSLDFKVYIHKIHMGANLPSVSKKSLNVLGTSGATVTNGIATGATQSPLGAGSQAPGTPYILGSTDYSTVIWPQDVRNCTTCHKGGTQSDNWKTNPNRAACGSCHDNINFETGANHPGGIQLDDTRCTICHKADTGVEFDLSIAGAHTMPWKSKRLKGLNVTITGVSNAQPGSAPVVSFTVSDNAGNPVNPAPLGRLLLTVAGPTSDYATDPPWQEDARNAKPGPTGYTYSFTGALPSDASGTWAVGAEAYRDVPVSGSLIGPNFTVRESIYNPVFYFSVDGSPVTPRRKVVDTKNCNVCHETLAHHGNARKNATEYCEMCHNPNHGDNNDPKTSVNFRTMAMGIHMGGQLENTYTVNTTNYNGLRFPGDQRNCAKCHVGTTYTVPLPDGLIPTIDATFFYSPLLPTASACLGCHNGVDAADHAIQMTAPFGESCPVCHEEGADFAVTKLHARNP